MPEFTEYMVKNKERKGCGLAPESVGIRTESKHRSYVSYETYRTYNSFKDRQAR